MAFLKLLHKKSSPPPDCRNCTDPDCPASPLNLKDYPLMVASEDLYDLSGNLIEKIVTQPQECPHQKKQPKKSKPKPPSQSFKKELRILRSEVRALSAELAAHLERSGNIAGTESDLGKSLEEIRADVAALEKSLAGLSISKEDANAVREYIEAVESISASIAAADEVQELQSRLDKSEERSADKKDLDKLQEELYALRQNTAGHSELEQMSARLEELVAKAADREALQELRNEVGALRSESAGKDRLEDLSLRLEEAFENTVGREDLAALRKDLETLRQGAALRNEVDELAARLALQSLQPADAKIEEFSQRLEDLKKQAPSRNELEELRSRLDLLGGSAADRSDLDKARAEIRDLKKSSARKEDLEIVENELSALSAKAADKKDLEAVRADLDKLRSVAATQEKTERLEQELGKLRQIAATRDDLAQTASELARLKSRAAYREQTDDLEDRLVGLEGRAADKAALEKALSRLSEMEKLSARKKELEEAVNRLTELERRAADKDKVAELADVAEELGSTDIRLESELADVGEKLRKQVKALSDELKSQSSLKADRQDLDALLDKTKELSDKKANHKDLLGLAEKLKEVINSAAYGKDLEALQKEHKEALAKTEESLAELRSSLEKAREENAAKEELTKLARKIDEVASRTQAVSSPASEYEESGHENADLGPRLREIESSAESFYNELKEKLDAVSGRLSEIEGGTAERADREDTSASLLSGFARQKIAELESEKAAKEDIERLRTELEKHAASEEEIARSLSARIEELQARLAETESKIPESSVSGEASRQLAEVARKFSELEKGVEDLRDFEAGIEAGGRFEERLGKVRSELRSASSKGEQDEDSGLQRVQELESQHYELKRQIRKAFENLTNYPLRELDEVKKKVNALERKQQQVSKPPPPRPATPARKQTKTKRNLAAAAMVILLAGVLGVALAWKWTGASESGGSAPEEAAHSEDTLNYVPNMVYDDITPALSAPTLYLSEKKLQLEEGKAEISGHAPGAKQAFLYINNEKRASTPVEDRFFDFDKVFLDYGVNVIEVKVVDNQGHEASSMAVMLERMSNTVARMERAGTINRMRGPTYLPHLALTIDGGGSNHRAVELLDVLKRKDIITTFFLTGQFIEKFPGTVKRIVADGHEVGNHTYSHPHLTTFHKNRRHYTSPGVNREYLRNQLKKTERLFEELTGVEMAPWWRAPYGERNKEILEWAEDAGFKHIDWTRSPVNYDMLDWVADPSSRFYLDSEGLYKRLTRIDQSGSKGANGGIILVHLGSDREKHYLDQILPRAIEDLRKKGYRFVTISRMFNN